MPILISDFTRAAERRFNIFDGCAHECLSVAEWDRHWETIYDELHGMKMVLLSLQNFDSAQNLMKAIDRIEHFRSAAFTKRFHGWKELHRGKSIDQLTLEG